MAPQKQSICWKLITLQADRKTAVCDICKAELVFCKRGNTNLLRHLRTKHPFEMAQLEQITRLQSMVALNASTEVQLGPWNDVAVIANVPATVSASSISSETSSRQLTPQANIKSTTKYKAENPRKRELDACVLDLVTVDMQPLSVVENKAFRRFVNKLDPRYEIVSRKRLTSRMLPDRYHEEKGRLMSLLQDVKHVSITTDCWSSRAVESFMTVTVHFITNDWQLQSRVLSTLALQGSHTAEDLSSSLQDMFAEWGILEKVTTCVTDNAANIVSAVEMLKLKHQPCFAHMLNSVVKDSIKKTDDVFAAKNRLKAAVTFFHYSTIGTNHLIDAHKNSHSMFRKLKQDVETRWNSTYEMVESYIEQHDQVTVALCLSGKPTMCISTEELEVLRKAMATLAPFYEATVELSSERHTTVAKVIPLVNILRKMAASDNSPLGAHLHQQLQERFKTIDTKPHLHSHLMMATILDPRYKRNGFPSADSSDSAVRKLKEVASSIILSHCSVKQEETSAEEPAVPAKKPSLLWENYDRQVKERQQVTSNIMTATDFEVQQHLETASLPRDAKALDYWRDHCASLPRLSHIASDVLSIPATSVPGERLFSKVGELISNRRSLLKVKNIDMILFLNNLRDQTD